MVLSLIVIMLLSVGGFWSLLGLRNVFRPIEIAASFMALNVFIIEFCGMITLNLDFIQPSRRASVSWFLMLGHLAVAPCLLLWVLYAWFSPKASLVLKLALGAAVLLGLYGTELLFDELGYWKAQRWNLGYSALKWLSVLLPAWGFAAWFRRSLRKREVGL
ncbi:hypothetical protein I8J29_21725 [Paenibacillus sp. MWE-103]|uniref:Uncharacterized protein n=1 Tax=Paenibacillus artemisiicola TaxID=1172618 RepID=A0ABS3WET1_9BACL|nr:hypothetical protein [Paenibacillus artemisiicola]MBO7746840.1 hypothetical protein [Paenibacillus artemisiicola]